MEEWDTQAHQSHLELDGVKVAVSAIERFALDLLNCETDPFALRWAVIAGHDALYHLMISNLEGFNYHRVLDHNSLEKGRHRLIDFETALKRARDSQWMRQTMLSSPLQLCNADFQTLLRFHRSTRNRFVHYVPNLWAISFAYLFSQLDVVTRTIRKLAFDTRNINWHRPRGGVEFCERAKGALDRCEGYLESRKLRSRGALARTR